MTHHQLQSHQKYRLLGPATIQADNPVEPIISRCISTLSDLIRSVRLDPPRCIGQNCVHNAPK
jgi:hypothetical protein